MCLRAIKHDLFGCYPVAEETTPVCPPKAAQHPHCGSADAARLRVAFPTKTGGFQERRETHTLP